MIDILHLDGKVVNNLNFCDAERHQMHSHAERGNDNSKCKLENEGCQSWFKM